MKTQKNFLTLGGVLVALCLLTAGRAFAVPVTSGTLGLEPSIPDITSWGLNLDYNESADSFSILSDAAFYSSSANLGGGNESISNGTFSITGTANASTADLSFAITGDLASIDGGNQTLLAGDLLQLATDGGVIEFLFGNLTGAMSGLYGSQAGIIFSSFEPLNFTSDVSATLGQANTYAVPAPGTLGLSLLGLGGLLLSRRSNRATTSRD